MIDRLRNLRIFSRPTDTAIEAGPAAPVFTGLRLFSAELLLSAGANATLDYLRHGGARRRASAASRAEAVAGGRLAAADPQALAAAWVPTLLAAAACTAQVRHALEPSDRRHTATTLLNGAVVGFGIAGMAQGIAAAARGERSFSVAPLLFGYTGLLGFLLDRQEDATAGEAARLEQRARVVERLVPKRRTRVQKIVVHV